MIRQIPVLWSGNSDRDRPSNLPARKSRAHLLMEMIEPSRKSLAGPFSATHPREGYSGRISQSGVQVRYARKLRRITLQRFIISKMVYDLESVTIPELLALYDNLLWCQSKAQMDPNFQKKFGSFLEKVASLLKETRLPSRNLEKGLRAMVPKLREAAEGHLFPRRNLNGVERYCKGKFHVLPTQIPGIPRRELPPVKFIGIGYRDKGTRRDLAKDGSPRWQDVALYFARKEEE